MKADLLQFTSLLTWWWLPSFGSQLLLNACYSLSIVTPPTPSAHRLRNNHLQLARTAVIVGTLLYQLYNAAATATPNYYQLLGLPLDVDAEGVKRSFRALARRYHPDKVGEQGEAFFILLRRAHDALSDPTKRFAYDRFGASIAEWKDCDSTRDFMRRGLLGLVAFYTVNPAMYALFGFINGGRSDGLSFWRLACLFTLLAGELSLLVAPEYPTWMALLPNTTIHDVRQLAHALFVNFFFASLQLSNALDVLEYGEQGPPARDAKSKALRAQIQLEALSERVQAVAQTAEMAKVGMVHSFARELRPFRRGVGGKESEGGKGGDEREKVWDRIDTVLLSRSLVQQHPQLLALAEVGKAKEKVDVEQEQLVKEEESLPVAQGSEEVSVKEEQVKVPLEHDGMSGGKAGSEKMVEVKSEKLTGLVESATSSKSEDATAATPTIKLEAVESSVDGESVMTEPWIHLQTGDTVTTGPLGDGNESTLTEEVGGEKSALPPPTAATGTIKEASVETEQTTSASVTAPLESLSVPEAAERDAAS